jgi:hypothetical protein
VEKRLVKDVKRLSAELFTTRGELKAERKSRVDSKNVLWAQVAEVEALKETTMQSLRDSTSSREILEKELDGDCGFLFALFFCLLCFCSLIRLLDLIS